MNGEKIKSSKTTKDAKVAQGAKDAKATRIVKVADATNAANIAIKAANAADKAANAAEAANIAANIAAKAASAAAKAAYTAAKAANTAANAAIAAAKTANTAMAAEAVNTANDANATNDAKAPKKTKAPKRTSTTKRNSIETPPSGQSDVNMKHVNTEPVAEQSKVPEDNPTEPPGKPVVSVANNVLSNEESLNEKPEICDKKIFEVVHRMSLVNMLKKEKSLRPKQRYMSKIQVEITSKDRLFLINWMVTAAAKEDLDDETLYLAVSLIDRFMSETPVKKCHMRLLGAAALYIAVKSEESDDDFEFLDGKNYVKRHVEIMERIILLTLCFQVRTPTACAFIFTYATLFDMELKLLNLTLYISELALTQMNEKTYMRFLPSKIAFASHALARHLLGMEAWTPELEENTSYTPNDLANVALKLSLIHKSAANHLHQVTRVKFLGMEYQRVAEVQAVELTNEMMEEFIEMYNSQDIQKMDEDED